MIKNFKGRLDEASTLADIFELVKDAVQKSLGRHRAGLMLGMADLGNSPQAFLGAFYPMGSNVIVMNKIPLQRIKETRPEIYKPYAFHVLMHEYLHSLGYIDEALVKSKVSQITRDALGDDHLATALAADTTCFFKHMVYPHTAWQPHDEGIELVRDFDQSSASYIA